MRLLRFRMCFALLFTTLLLAAFVPAPAAASRASAKQDPASPMYAEQMVPVSETSFPRLECRRDSGTHPTAIQTDGARPTESVRQTLSRLAAIYSDIGGIIRQRGLIPVGSHAPPVTA